MKIFNIVLHITLVICTVLLLTQQYWVEPLTNYLVDHFYVLPIAEVTRSADKIIFSTGQ